jgi:hypothetical protein
MKLGVKGCVVSILTINLMLILFCVIKLSFIVMEIY